MILVLSGVAIGLGVLDILLAGFAYVRISQLNYQMVEERRQAAELASRLQGGLRKRTTGVSG